jgi:hypothetical protein
MFGFDQTLPSLYSENNVKIDLGVGIGHRIGLTETS